jgi:molecular chaperone DnaJ
MIDFYVILGLEHGATESDIKRAYRRLARRYHPDINPGDRMAEARFRQILEAYETLIDPDRRSRYESGHPVSPAREARTSGFEGFDFTGRAGDHAVTFGDLFAEVLSSRAAARPGQERGADLHQDLRLTFDESFTGVVRSVTVTRRESCRQCAGTGLARAPAGACLVCHGAGTVRSTRGHMVFSRVCAACGGSGQQRPRRCEPCGGSGQDVRAETIEVEVPAGVADGDRVRVEGRGNGGVHGGAPGDLNLTIRVAPHPLFRRLGQDVQVSIDLAIHEAALGARIEVPAPGGAVKLRIPPGTQSGQRFRLRERGMPSPRDGHRGDLLVDVQMKLPQVLDERSKELLREFGRINGALVRETAGPRTG